VELDVWQVFREFVADNRVVEERCDVGVDHPGWAATVIHANHDVPATGRQSANFGCKLHDVSPQPKVARRNVLEDIRLVLLCEKLTKLGRVNAWFYQQHSARVAKLNRRPRRRSCDAAANSQCSIGRPVGSTVAPRPRQ
jgi:hypothetical protein